MGSTTKAALAASPLAVCLAVVLAFTSACGRGALRSSSRTTIRSPGGALSASDLDTLRHTVETVRRLDFGDDLVPILQIEEDAFRALVREHLVPPSGNERRLAGLFDWRGSGPARGRRAGAADTKPFDELVAAFYDVKRDRIVAPIDADGPTPHKLGILAHELQHALQERHFEVAALAAKTVEDDAALALSALVEGDAQVTMGAYLGATHGIPVSRALRRLTDLVAGVPIRHEGGGRTFGGGHDLHLVSFPYEEGMRFAADLHRTGGFELIDRAFASPPTATMHILHPERYLAGELPVELDAPEPVGEWLGHGTWGELRTALALSPCHPVVHARAVAAGWRGDRYTLGARARESTLTWLSVWRHEAAAAAFEEALVPCAAVRRRVARHGDRVLVTVGATDAEHNGLAARLASHGVRVPLATPLTDAAIPPRVPIPPRRKGRIEGRRFRSIWLGLEGELPRGVEGRVPDDPSLELVVDDRASGARGLLALSDHVPRGRALDALFAEVLGSLRASADAHVARAGRTRRTSSLGPAIAERYHTGTTTFDVEVIPVCADTGALILVGVFHDAEGRETLASWRDRLTWIAGRRLPACRWLDPK